MKGPHPKHVPVRTCIACREEGAKRELVRLVRTPAGRVEIDRTGKLSGRGAYLCQKRACWELAVKKHIITRALQTALSPEETARIEEFATGLPV